MSLFVINATHFTTGSNKATSPRTQMWHLWRGVKVSNHAQRHCVTVKHVLANSNLGQEIADLLSYRKLLTMILVFSEASARRYGTEDIFNCKKKKARALSVCRVLTFHAALHGIFRENCLCSCCFRIQFHHETSIFCRNGQSWLVQNGIYLKLERCSI